MPMGRCSARKINANKAESIPGDIQSVKKAEDFGAVFVWWEASPFVFTIVPEKVHVAVKKRSEYALLIIL